MQQDKSGQFFIKSLQGLYVREVYRFLVHLMRHACMSFGWTNTSTNIKWLFNETVEQRRVCASSPCAAAYSASGSAMSPNPLHHDRALPPFLAYLLADRCRGFDHRACLSAARRSSYPHHGWSPWRGEICGPASLRGASRPCCTGPACRPAGHATASCQPPVCGCKGRRSRRCHPPARIPGRAGPSQGGIGRRRPVRRACLWHRSVLHSPVSQHCPCE